MKISLKELFFLFPNFSKTNSVDSRDFVSSSKLMQKVKIDVK
jgi:hypothetical protein